MFTSSWCLTFTTGLLFSVSSYTINGQTIRPHLLCSNSTVTVLAGASGVIQHVKEGRDMPCTLRLSGFASGSYLNLLGIDTSKNNCGTSVTVNSINYCVRGSQSQYQIIVQLTGEELNVTLPSARENSSDFYYYSNVAVCKRTLTIPEGAEASQLSGVVSSSYNISTRVSLEDCRVGIELPSPNISLRFELLFTSGDIDIQVGDKMFPLFVSKGDSRLVMTRSEKSINLSATKGDDDDGRPSYRSFVIRVTVLHCGDIPEIPHSTNSTTPTPWLPGSEVTYSCVSGWMLSQTKENSIDCQVDGNSKTARWTSHTNILCIPEPWCQTSPSQVPNSEYKVEDNLTATYECIKGYTTNSSESERKIVCSSPDRLTTPWEWSSATFQCLPVECNLTADYRNISNGESVVKRYYYEDKLDYECHDGYEQVTDVICTSNGTWSTTPNCSIDSSESNPLLTEQQILIIGSVGGLLGLILVVGVVVYLCVRKARDEETKTQRGLTAPSDDDVSGGQENPYHALEPPDVISNSADFVTGAYALVPLNFVPSAQTGTQANPKNMKKSSSVQKKDRHLPTEEVYADLGPRQSALKPPVKAKQQYTSEEPVNDESPAVPAKLDPVIFEENSLYESSGPPAARSAQSQPVEMLDNDLYDRS